jgi:hypothetical protein
MATTTAGGGGGGGGGARGRANYDELIKLLLIGDSGESWHSFLQSSFTHTSFVQVL